MDSPVLPDFVDAEIGPVEMVPGHRERRQLQGIRIREQSSAAVFAFFHFIRPLL